MQKKKKKIRDIQAVPIRMRITSKERDTPNSVRGSEGRERWKEGGKEEKKREMGIVSPWWKIMRGGEVGQMG